ncbi:MAG TPA: hypothetical protein VLJ42_10430 [Solirubrobacteraceae bacterium]|nr:hypothetical protein [Solirubrobacteraceae bacterium]
MALIREVRREWLARVDRLLSQFGELESGADPDIVPRLAQSFWSVFTAQDARCERAPTRNKPEWQTCSCPVCHATRSLDDNFGVEIELEALLESACAVAYGGEMDRTDDYIVERLLEVVDQTFCGFVFGERVYAGALRALTGKQR